jgi:hypothetical protein
MMWIPPSHPIHQSLVSGASDTRAVTRWLHDRPTVRARKCPAPLPLRPRQNLLLTESTDRTA